MSQNQGQGTNKNVTITDNSTGKQATFPLIAGTDGPPVIDIRKLLANNHITDFADLFRLLYDEVDGYGKGHVAECILIIARYELSDSQVVDKEINAMAMLIELLGVIK